MATTDLKLDEPGSLTKPGPIGRLARLALGVMCLWYVKGLILTSGHFLNDENHVTPLIWNGVLIGLFLISYIVNIGFSRKWGKWPAIVSAIVFLALAGFGLLSVGRFETLILAQGIWVWELYLFSHLGIAFMISSLIGTPGCELRAFHDLYSRLTGVATMEHYCPVGPLNHIDRWEAARLQANLK
jgi:hypothetical protein